MQSKFVLLFTLQFIFYRRRCGRETYIELSLDLGVFVVVFFAVGHLLLYTHTHRQWIKRTSVRCIARGVHCVTIVVAFPAFDRCKKSGSVRFKGDFSSLLFLLPVKGGR